MNKTLNIFKVKKEDDELKVNDATFELKEIESCDKKFLVCNPKVQNDTGKEYDIEEIRENFLSGTWELIHNGKEQKTPLERLEHAKVILPEAIYNDVKSRMEDWLESGGREIDPYMYKKLEYAKKFVEGV